MKINNLFLDAYLPIRIFISMAEIQRMLKVITSLVEVLGLILLIR